MKTKDPLLLRRIVLALVGVAITGISIGFFKRALFGVDPFQCFSNGLANVIPIRFGTLYMLLNLALVALDFFLDRHYIGISTFINMFLMGYIIEFSEDTLTRLFGDLGFPARVLFLAIGILVTCVGAALYYTADLGVSSYDAIPLHFADKKLKVAGHVLPFRVIRIISDLICTGVGVALGATAGVGTVVTALFMGPLIAFFRKNLSDPLLYGKGGQPG